MSSVPLLPEPPLSQTRQGEDTYPRVIRQERRADGSQLVTFALPGLRRARMVVPNARWLDLEHLAVHPAMMARLGGILSQLRPDPEPDDT